MSDTYTSTNMPVIGSAPLLSFLKQPLSDAAGTTPKSESRTSPEAHSPKGSTWSSKSFLDSLIAPSNPSHSPNFGNSQSSTLPVSASAGSPVSASTSGPAPKSQFMSIFPHCNPSLVSGPFDSTSKTSPKAHQINPDFILGRNTGNGNPKRSANQPMDSESLMFQPTRTPANLAGTSLKIATEMSPTQHSTVSSPPSEEAGLEESPIPSSGNSSANGELSVSKELRDIKKLLKKIHVDELQLNLQQVEEEKILLSLEDRLIDRMGRLLESKVSNLAHELRDATKRQAVHEATRTDKILSFIGEQLNANIAHFIEETIEREVKESMSHYVAHSLNTYFAKNLSTLLQSALKQHLPASLNGALHTAFSSDALAASLQNDKVAHLIGQQLQTAVATSMADHMVPSLTQSVSKYLQRSEGLFRDALEMHHQTSSAMMSMTESLTFDQLNVTDYNLERLEACLVEGNDLEALVRLLHVHDDAVFMDFLTHFSSMVDLSLVTLPRLMCLLSRLTHILAQSDDAGQLKLAFAWFEETLVAIDLMAESFRTEQYRPLTSESHQSTLKEGLKMLKGRSAVLLRQGGLPEKSLRLTLRMLQSLLS